MIPINITQMGSKFAVFFLLLLFWTLFWKGYALWTAAKREERGWFAALLVINTAGILEIVYLFGIAKKKLADIQATFLKIISFGKK